MPGGRIIVAEDNRILQDVIRFNLSRAGYEVLTADNGQQVLDILKDHTVNLLVTDCQMPGISGLELVRILRADWKWKQLPILFCTAKGFEIEPQVLTELNLPELVCKPFSPAELIQRVNGMLRRTQNEHSDPSSATVGVTSRSAATDRETESDG